ncbi:MAG: DUF2264 domain-containing protein [Tannerella sp.]|jgi:hypothetical protein|nr:DUF2264 domain-containing protein [Tannerella sp.]
MKKFIIYFSVFSAGLFLPVNAGAVNKLNAKDDFRTSPYTGYTKAHWLEIAEKLISGALSYVNPETGIFNLPKSTGAYLELEDFRNENQARIMERIMVGVIIYTTATGKDEIPGYKGSITKPFINAVTRGTDPQSDGYWGDPDPNDQIGVSFAMGIYMCPEKFWDPLSKKQQENLIRFFRKQSFNVTYHNNHYFFHLFATSLIEKYGDGIDSNRAHHTKMIKRLLGWYRGDGWFIDGNNRGFDYYNFWGFQLFNQMIYKYDPVWRAQFGDRIQETTSRFLEVVRYNYSREGGQIPWGRSLTYRFSSNAAIGWAMINDNKSMSPGMARRILSGNMKYFWDNGCISENGLLDIGYLGKNQSVAEPYIVPGDPYFAMHGLACLLLPAGHPFWTTTEEPMPADAAGGKIAVRGAQFSLNVSPVDGDARLYPAGQPFSRTIWQSPVKYNQHAYSSMLGFCITGEGAEDTGAGRTGYSYDGKQWLYRFCSRTLFTEADHVASVYHLRSVNKDDQTPEFQKDELITHTLIGNDGEVHVFWHNYPDPLYLSIGGYGINIPHNTVPKEDRTADRLLIHGDDYYATLQTIETPEGVLHATLLKPREGWTNTHLFGGLGAYCSWQSSEGIAPHTPVAVYVNGTKKRVPARVDVKVEKMPGGLIVTFEGKQYQIKIIN